MIKTMSSAAIVRKVSYMARCGEDFFITSVVCNTKKLFDHRYIVFG